MKRILSLLLIGLFVFGCGPVKKEKQGDKDGDFENAQFVMDEIRRGIDLTWRRGPYALSGLRSHLLIEVTNRRGELIDLPRYTRLAIYGVKAQGGSSANFFSGYFERVDVGRYYNEEIRFDGRGTWQLQLKVEDPGGEVKDGIAWLVNL